MDFSLGFFAFEESCQYFLHSVLPDLGWERKDKDEKIKMHIWLRGAVHVS